MDDRFAIPQGGMADRWHLRVGAEVKAFVFPLAMMLLIELIIVGINKALAPYEAAFWTYGGYATVAFIALFWGIALDERLHRMEHTPAKRIVR